jgi:single-strand DNA-binding protein
MNKVVLIGRITKDLELRKTKSDKSVCEFTLATNRVGSEDADFISCMVWNQQAENLCKFQGKGSLIAVFGELRTDSYEIEGQKRYKTYVLVSNVEFLSKKTESTQDINKISSKTEVQQTIEYSDSDLPW